MKFVLIIMNIILVLANATTAGIGIWQNEPALWFFVFNFLILIVNTYFIAKKGPKYK